jgi:hypothetical protein
MKTYQSFAKVKETSQLINTEIKAKSKKEALLWFTENTFYHENIHLKK